MDAAVPPPRPWARVLVGSMLLLLAGAGVGWAGSAVLAPPTSVLNATPFTYVDVVPGEVGSSINLNTAAEWSLVPVGSNQAVGTVTGVNVTAGQEVTAGATLYSVNLRPVVIAQGDVPAFRALAQDAVGTDVAQLQRALSALNLYRGSASGTFTAATTTAVKAWQEASGVPQDGVVQPGDVVFVPTLPTRVSLATSIVTRGAALVGGEPVVSSLPAAPAFTVPVTETQAALIPIGTRVEIANPQGGLWDGFVTGRAGDELTGLVVNLQGKDGAVLCGDVCAQIPVEGKTLLSSKIVTVETRTGLTIPSAALLSAADGTVSVIGKDGAEYPVNVLTSARGISVITGVDEGLSVRIPASGG